MYQSRIAIAGATPLPAFSGRSGFGSARVAEPAASLVVDLGTDLFSADWWRGLATLAALSTAVALLAPGLEPLPGGRAQRLDIGESKQFEALGVGALGAGSRTGLRMVETAAVEPLPSAPQRTSVALFATLGQGEGLARLLMRSGAVAADAVRAEALVRSAGRKLALGTSVSLTLGAPLGGGRRPVNSVALRAGLDLKLSVQRTDAGLQLTRTTIPVDSRPLRIRGRVGAGLYWSLRSAGASPATVAAYLQALATRIEVGSEVGAEDRFDLVVVNRRTASGESVGGPLLYAGLDRVMGGKLQLLRWPVGGQAQWIDAADGGQARASGSGMLWPVQAPITSRFGPRVHPILRFLRMHKGIDFGARWGHPIVAASDGQVVRAGWAGGYGRQVRVAHAGGIVTSYSHMSRIVAEPGALVRRGQLIGYVGSSGLSTGPHLHFETLRGGVAVNPMSVRFAATATVDAGQAAAVRARVKALLGS